MPTRRRWLQRVLALLLMPLAGRARGAGLVEGETLQSALQKLYGHAEFQFSDRIQVTAPALAEDGAVVPVKIVALLPDVSSITIIADHNPAPVVARFMIQAPVRPRLSTRIKLAETTDLRVLVTTPGGTFEARTRVRVVQGGCDVMPEKT